MNLTRVLSLLLLILSLSFIPVQGNDGTENRTIKWQLDRLYVNLPQALRTASKKDSTLHLHQAYILENLTAQGFFNARIDSISFVNEKNEAVIHSVRGCRFSIGDFSVNAEFTSDNQSNPGPSFNPIVYSGVRYSETVFKNEIDRYLRHYENQGYMLARIDILQFEPNSDTCQIHIGLEVTPGPQMRVTGQIIPPLKRNNPDYLERASGIREGMFITPNLLRNARLNLENTGLFEKVGEPQLVQRDSLFYVMHDVTESRVNALDLLVGYVPRPQGGNTVVGTGQLMIRNALLDGSRMHLAFERLQQLVTKLDARFDTRWIAGYPIGAGIHFNFLQQDSTYQVRSLGLEGRYSLSATTELIGTLRQESSSTNAAPNVPITVFDANVWFAGIGLEYRQTDNIRNPTRGFEGRLLAETGVKRITDSRLEAFSDIRRLNQREINMRFKAFINPFRRQVIAPSLYGYVLISEEFTETDLNRFGGASSFRGYREDQFQSSRMLWSDLEYRYLLDQYSYAFIFGAMGYYERPKLVTEMDDGLQIEDWLYSYGFGFQYITPIGIMKFSYAISPEDELSNGKVHVGIEARF